jgi:hypothetical protein
MSLDVPLEILSAEKLLSIIVNNRNPPRYSPFPADLLTEGM